MSTKKVQRGTIYTANKQVIMVKPEDGKRFSLKELQTAVGGYIEPIIPLDSKTKLYVNEEGLIHNLPPNDYTEIIAKTKSYGGFLYPHGLVIRGNAISTYLVAPGLEQDSDRMLIKEVFSGKS